MLAAFAFLRTAIGGAPWKLIGVGLGALGVLFAVGLFVSTMKQNGRLSSQLDAAIEISNVNATVTKQVVADTERSNDITAKAGKAKNEIRKKSAAVKQTIIDSLPADDGVLAPVLRRELDRLPEPPVANAPRTFDAFQRAPSFAVTR